MSLLRAREFTTSLPTLPRCSSKALKSSSRYRAISLYLNLHTTWAMRLYSVRPNKTMTKHKATPGTWYQEAVSAMTADSPYSGPQSTKSGATCICFLLVHLVQKKCQKKITASTQDLKRQMIAYVGLGQPRVYLQTAFTDFRNSSPLHFVTAQAIFATAAVLCTSTRLSRRPICSAYQV